MLKAIKHPWPALVLFLLTPLVAETIFSFNVPFVTFLNPLAWLWLGILYGIPALLLRELWVRGTITPERFALFGIIYAAFNEGVIANTWFRSEALGFTNTALARSSGINWQLVFGLVTYHTFISMLVPIVLVHTVQKQHAKTAWLSDQAMRFAWILLAIVGLAATLPRTAAGLLQPNFGQRFALLVLLGICAYGLLHSSRRITHSKQARPFNPLRWHHARQLVMIGCALMALFLVLFFVLPNVIPRINLGLHLIFYCLTASFIVRCYKSKAFTVHNAIPLIAGAALVSAILSLAHLATLQPLALGGFAWLLWYAYTRK